MGLDLKLYPKAPYRFKDWVLGVDVLRMWKDDGLVEFIYESSLRKPLPPGIDFECFGEEGLIKEKDDSYGDPLTYITSNEFVKIYNDNKKEIELAHDNKAILAFMNALDNYAIILYFC